MKKIIFGLILATALILSSCGPKGGTITVKNNFSVTVAGITAQKEVTVTVTPVSLTLSKSEKTIKPGESANFSYDDDGDFVITVDLISVGLGAKVNPSTVHLSGGETKTVKIE